MSQKLIQRMLNECNQITDKLLKTVGQANHQVNELEKLTNNTFLERLKAETLEVTPDDLLKHLRMDITKQEREEEYYTWNHVVRDADEWADIADIANWAYKILSIKYGINFKIVDTIYSPGEDDESDLERREIILSDGKNFYSYWWKEDPAGWSDFDELNDELNMFFRRCVPHYSLKIEWL